MPKTLNHDKTSLWKRCKDAAGWALIGSGGTHLIRFLRVMLVTYFIVPEQMGLWVIMITVIGMFNECTDSGVKHALIQNPRADQYDYLNCAWLIGLVRSLVLILLLFFLAPLIGKYYQSKFDDIELVRILRMGCFLFLFDGLSSIGLVALRKALNFKPLVAIQLTSNIVGLIAAIYFSWQWHHAQGILVGEILCSLILCILSYCVHPFRPSFVWKKKIALELLSYGGITYLVAMVDAIAISLDIIIISEISFMDTGIGEINERALVGLYGFGRIIIMAATVFLSQLSVTIGFPTLSQLQQDRSVLRRGLLEITKATQFIALPLFAILFLLAPDLVKVLSSKYAGTGLVIRYLSVAGFVLVFLRQLTPALYAINRVHWCIWRGLLHMIVFAILIYPFSQRWGLAGVCWATNITYLVSMLMIFWVTLRLLHWPLLEWFNSMSLFVRPVLGGAIAFVVAYCLLQLAGLTWEQSLVMRLGCCFCALLVYGLLNIGPYLIPLKKTLYSGSARPVS